MDNLETNPEEYRNNLLRDIDLAKDLLKKEEQFNRLINSQDFKDVILKGFCVDDCSQYNLMIHDPFTSPELKQQAKTLLKSGAGINLWIAAKKRMFENAKLSLAEAEKALTGSEE